MSSAVLVAAVMIVFLLLEIKEVGNVGYTETRVDRVFGYKQREQQ